MKTSTDPDSSSSSEPAYWKRRKPKKKFIQQSFDHDISAIANLTSINRQWMSKFSRFFAEEHRIYWVDGSILDVQDMVQCLRRRASTTQLLSIVCQREMADQPQSDNCSSDNNCHDSDLDDPTAYHLLVIMGSDGVGGKFRLSPGDMPDPLAELLSDNQFTFVCCDSRRLKYHFATTIGAYLAGNRPNIHDICPILEAIMEIRSSFFGTHLLRCDPDSVWKLISERSGQPHVFGPLPIEKRAAICMDLYFLFESKREWIQSILEAHNTVYRQNIVLWSPFTHQREEEGSIASGTNQTNDVRAQDSTQRPGTSTAASVSVSQQPIVCRVAPTRHSFLGEHNYARANSARRARPLSPPAPRPVPIGRPQLLPPPPTPPPILYARLPSPRRSQLSPRSLSSVNPPVPPPWVQGRSGQYHGHWLGPNSIPMPRPPWFPGQQDNGPTTYPPWFPGQQDNGPTIRSPWFPRQQDGSTTRPPWLLCQQGESRATSNPVHDQARQSARAAQLQWGNSPAALVPWAPRYSGPVEVRDWSDDFQQF